MKFNKFFFITFFILSIIFSCSDDSSSSSSDGYNRQALLSNIVNNIIIPAHNNFKNELDLFKSNVEVFDNNRDITNLQQLQNQFVEAYKAWQHIEMFNIGYAEEIFYASKMNIYPANISRISDNINAANIDLDSNSNQYSAQGFLL